MFPGIDIVDLRSKVLADIEYFGGDERVCSREVTEVAVFDIPPADLLAVVDFGETFVDFLDDTKEADAFVPVLVVVVVVAVACEVCAVDVFVGDTEIVVFDGDLRDTVAFVAGDFGDTVLEGDARTVVSFVRVGDSADEGLWDATSLIEFFESAALNLGECVGEDFVAEGLVCFFNGLIDEREEETRLGDVLLGDTRVDILGGVLLGMTFGAAVFGRGGGVLDGVGFFFSGEGGNGGGGRGEDVGCDSLGDEIDVGLSVGTNIGVDCVGDGDSVDVDICVTVDCVITGVLCEVFSPSEDCVFLLVRETAASLLSFGGVAPTIFLDGGLVVD